MIVHSFAVVIAPGLAAAALYKFAFVPLDAARKVIGPDRMLPADALGAPLATVLGMSAAVALAFFENLPACSESLVGGAAGFLAGVGLQGALLLWEGLVRRRRSFDVRGGAAFSRRSTVPLEVRRIETAETRVSTGPATELVTYNLTLGLADASELVNVYIDPTARDDDEAGIKRAWTYRDATRTAAH